VIGDVLRHFKDLAAIDMAGDEFQNALRVIRHRLKSVAGGCSGQDRG